MDGLEKFNKSNEELELSILGSFIGSTDNYIKGLSKGIDRNYFYSTKNQNIFNAIEECYKTKGNTDVIVFYEMLEKHDISISYVSNVIAHSISFSDMTPYFNELIRLKIDRDLIQMSYDIKKGILRTSEDVKKRIEAIDLIKSKIGDNNSIITLDKVKIVDVYSLEKIPTGFEPIDRRLLGYAMGSLSIITGYNANGKSTLINQMCIAESLSQGYKVFAYSPELTNSNLKSWLYPTIANDEHFLNKTYQGKEYKTLGSIGVNYIDEWIRDKLFIYSDDSITSDEEKLLTDMNMLATQGIRVFIIDNLMKIDFKDSYKNEYIAQKIFVNKLKNLARKYNAVVHLVAHPKKPQAGSSKITKFDIAGAGDITNLADYVVSITRVTDEMRAEKVELEGKDAVIKVMKDRIKGNGEFAITLNFDSDRKRFYSNLNELNKDYGYTNKHEIVQVEINEKFQGVM